MEPAEEPAGSGSVQRLRSDPAARPPRDLVIDRFRGILVFLMIAGNFLGGVRWVPDAIKHPPDVGLTVADLVAPAFVLAIGLTYGTSFRRRHAASPSAAYRHFFVRYLALIGIGAILTAGGDLVGQPTDWGVLQALGVAGLVCLPFVRLGVAARFAIGFAILIGYQLALNLGALDAVRSTVQGGLIGAVSWGALLILSTAVADLRLRGIRASAIGCAALVVAAAVSVALVPVSKHRVSLSYVLVTLAVAAIVVLAADLVSRVLPRRAGYLAWWGENPLALYLLHLLVLGLVVLPGVPWWYEDAPPWLTGVQLAVIIAVVSLAAWLLHRRRLRIEL